MSSNKNNTQTPETTAVPEIVQTTETAQTPEITQTPEIKKVKIRLPKMKGQTGDVFVSVNNYTCVIKRGEEVEVPEFVKEVLTHQEEMLETIQAFEERVQK